MAKPKPTARGRPQGAFTPPPAPDAFGKPSPTPSGDDQVQASPLSLHDLFAQQARAMLDRADLNEEEKQGVLIAMSCPCCGAGGLSFTAKIRRGS